MLTPEEAEKWAQALESGKYQQCRGSYTIRLDGNTAKHCCLGVLYEISPEFMNRESREAFAKDKIGIAMAAQYIEYNDKLGLDFKAIAVKVREHFIPQNNDGGRVNGQTEVPKSEG